MVARLRITSSKWMNLAARLTSSSVAVDFSSKLATFI